MKQLYWRCRRGIKELDLVLQAFMDGHYPSLPDADKQLFESLLDEADPDLWNWITGRTMPPNPDYRPLIEKFKALNRHDHAG